MAADKFGGRVNDNRRSVIKGAQQIRCRNGVVHYSWYTVSLTQLGNGSQIDDIQLGVADALDKESLGIFFDGALPGRHITRRHEAHLNAQPGKSVRKQTYRAAV